MTWFLIPFLIFTLAQQASPTHWPAIIAVSYYEQGRTWQIEEDADGNLIMPSVGDSGYSFGPCQFHLRGLGYGHDPAMLQRYDYSFQLMARHIEDQLARGYTLYEALGPWTVRDMAWPLMLQIQAGNYEVEGGPPVVLVDSGEPRLALDSGIPDRDRSGESERGVLRTELDDNKCVSVHRVGSDSSGWFARALAWAFFLAKDGSSDRCWLSYFSGL